MPSQAPYAGGTPPISQQSLPAAQMNGPLPQIKTMPHSPSPQSQSSPGQLRGLSPAPNPSHQSHNLAPSPAASTGQPAKAASPCPSPSVGSHRSMPASPASMSSPHPGPADSQSSPRIDMKSSPAAPTTPAQNSPQLTSTGPKPSTPLSKPGTPLQAGPNAAASPLAQQPRPTSQAPAGQPQPAQQVDLRQQFPPHTDTQMSTAFTGQTQPGGIPSNQPGQMPVGSGIPAGANMNHMPRPGGQMPGNFPRQQGPPQMPPGQLPPNPHGQQDPSMSTEFHLSTPQFVLLLYNWLQHLSSLFHAFMMYCLVMMENSVMSSV